MTFGVGAVRRLRATDLAVIKKTERALGFFTHLSLADKTVLDVGFGYGLQTLEASLEVT